MYQYFSWKQIRSCGNLIAKGILLKKLGLKLSRTEENFKNHVEAEILQLCYVGNVLGIFLMKIPNIGL